MNITIQDLYNLFLSSTGVSTDTRKIAPQSIFFALKGGNFNGNLFAEDALSKGAKYVVVDDPNVVIDDSYLLVDDVLIALQQLASFHRKQLVNTVFIGLTGSNGKTTTKELINAVLSSTYKVIATQGNLNNHIGVPLTILSVSSDSDFAIIEMGANAQKEIAFLCDICEPDFGLITNIGKAHLEGFGGEDGVRIGKKEIFDFLKYKNRKFFINKNEPSLQFLFSEADPSMFISLGLQDHLPVDYLFAIQSDSPVSLLVNNQNIHSNYFGSYNANNVMLAISIGLYFKCDLSLIAASVLNYIPSNNRSQIFIKADIKYVLDAYNANPSSVDKVIEYYKNQKPLFILGDMNELGETSALEHKNVLEKLTNYGLEACLVGTKYAEFSDTFKQFSYYGDVSTFKMNYQLKHPFVVIKGSRSNALEKIIED